MFDFDLIFANYFSAAIEVKINTIDGYLLRIKNTK